jgi:predicted NBD/HSP70 family sugar kinase
MEPILTTSNASGVPKTDTSPAEGSHYTEFDDVGAGIQVDNSYIAIIVADFSGNVEHTRVIEGNFINSDPQTVLAQAGQALLEAISDCDCRRKLVGVTLALPGLVNSIDGKLVTSSNLNWKDIFPAPMLGLGDIPVTVANDAKMGALAEWQLSGDPSFVYLTFGAGIGGAIIQNGKLYRGERGWDCEFGHMVVSPNGPDCECGSRGCLEQYASKRAVLTAAGLSPETATVDDVLNLIDQGDANAKAAVENGALAVAMTLSNILTVVDVRNIVIDGELSAFQDICHNTLTRFITNQLLLGKEAPVTERGGMAGEFGPALGGALLAMHGY